MSEEEAMAEAWLKIRGYSSEFNPSIVTEGKNPDFIARGNADPKVIWAEVKSLSPELRSIAMDEAWEIIKAFDLPTNLRGHGTLWVDGNTRKQSVRTLLKLFSENAPKFKDQVVRLAFIQQTLNAGGERRVDFDDDISTDRIWIRGPGERLAAGPPASWKT